MKKSSRTPQRNDARASSRPYRLRHPNLLGGIGVEEFLAEYWQKKPLLVRGAIPGFGGALTKTDMLDLAARDDVESRFVTQAGGAWQLAHGPFPRTRSRRWQTPWSVLVQGVNLIVPEGDELLAAFDFVPHARLDDLMVSYATDGGGVGPHFDSYDVFLLQGTGRRRWRIGRQRDRRLIDGLPVRILRDFRPTHEWLLEPGDMLYLPPDWAHDGIAEGECMTWSIGFRAFPAQELADQFLTFLQERIRLQGEYRDPDLRLQRHPAEIGGDMVTQISRLLADIRWTEREVGEFLGAMLTEPKPHVFFDPPAAPLARRGFTTAIARGGVRLDARTRLLFAGTRFYLNGESIAVPQALRGTLRMLADRRHLPATACADRDLSTLMFGWYLDGFLHPGA